MFILKNIGYYALLFVFLSCMMMAYAFAGQCAERLGLKTEQTALKKSISSCHSLESSCHSPESNEVKKTNKIEQYHKNIKDKTCLECYCYHCQLPLQASLYPSLKKDILKTNSIFHTKYQKYFYTLIQYTINPPPKKTPDFNYNI